MVDRRTLSDEEDCTMVIRGKEIPATNGRRPYPLDGREIPVRHFVIRVTTPDNPFKPHQHEQPELWYIVDGEALVALDGQEHAVEGMDLVVIDPWVEHGLRTGSQATWICLG
jgi:mannose-6-phosphate isomerase-like protein (cupin superfamily)